MTESEKALASDIDKLLTAESREDEICDAIEIRLLKIDDLEAKVEEHRQVIAGLMMDLRRLLGDG